MRNLKRLKALALVAAGCLAAPAWLLAQAQQPAAPEPATVQPDRPDQPRPQQPPTAIEPDRPMLMVNKCSKLVGATVKDTEGDSLGKIDDVVVDFDTGRVSYCALKVKESAFSKAKYLAVPLAALHPSVDGLYLILNADKQKIAQARSFDKNNWPAMNNPAWGAQPFWQGASPATPSQNQYISPNAAPDLSPNRNASPTTISQPNGDKNAPPENR